MLYKLRNRARDEQGFTLIELLVVVLIIGILAAIALPNFLGQRTKAQDSSAKSNARNAVSHVESCYATEQNMANCQTPAQLNDGAPMGFTPAEVTIAAAGTAGYTIQGISVNGHTFNINKADGTGTITRPCTAVGKGGCPASGLW